MKYCQFKKSFESEKKILEIEAKKSFIWNTTNVTD